MSQGALGCTGEQCLPMGLYLYEPHGALGLTGEQCLPMAVLIRTLGCFRLDWLVKGAWDNSDRLGYLSS